MNGRRHELDWLRVLAILVVFLYHSTRFFNLGDWHVKNLDTYVWVEIWNVFVTRWMMPLFFIISGASLAYTIGKPGGFRKVYADKFLRLMIPVLVAVVTHSAVQVYLDRVSHHLFSGSFMAFLPEYFHGLFVDAGMPGNFPFHGMHLWYLLVLFVYTLFCYPLFRRLAQGGRRLLDRVTKVIAVPVLIYLWLSLPLLVLWAVLPQAVLSAGAGGWGFLYYLWFLIAGFTIASSDKLGLLIRNQRRTSLVLGAAFMLAYLFQIFSPSRLVLPAPLGDWAMALLNFLGAWCLLSAIVGFGMQHLSFGSPFLQKANEGVLPFYIMHQTVLVVVGFWVVSWDIPDLLKWLIIFSVSFFILIGIYLLVIRRSDFFRFLFGMKTARPFYAAFAGRKALVGFHVLYLGLFAFAFGNEIAGTGADRQAMPVVYDHRRDIVLDSGAITDQSPAGVLVVRDEDASAGRAIEFTAGATPTIEPRPGVYVDMTFSAPAGTYVVWLRGKAESDDILTDSIHLQWDQSIGTGRGVASLGNWLDIHPAGAYAWASNGNWPVTILLRHGGRHALRLQPRQTPHRIDQIWLSRFQYAVPDTSGPLSPPK